MNAGLNSTTIVASSGVRGSLVVIDGPDRVGKSTQVARLARRLEEEGRAVKVSREPGGDQVGEALRTVILETQLDPWTELLLFLAGRARHLAEVVEPALRGGELVLLDRYTPSTLVYQGAMLGDVVVGELTSLPVFLVPNVTVILDCVNPLAAFDDADRFERRGLRAWEERRSRYLSFARQFGWIVVSGDGPEQAVTDRLLAVLSSRGMLG